MSRFIGVFALLRIAIRIIGMFVSVKYTVLSSKVRCRDEQNPFCCKTRIHFAAKRNFVLLQNTITILLQNEVASCCKTKTHFAAT